MRLESVLDFDSDLSYSKTVSVRLLSHSITDLVTITRNVLESHDSTIVLQSNGNQALTPYHITQVYYVSIVNCCLSCSVNVMLYSINSMQHLVQVT